MKTTGVVLSGIVLAACAQQAAKYDPFRVPRETFRDSLKVVAVAPVLAPRDLEDAERVTARFAATLEAKLAAAGLRVVPPSVAGPIFQAAEERAGGLYDPKTGELDEAKFQAALKEALAELRAKHGADALLRPALAVVRARLVRDVATWDGVSESVGGFWKSFFGGTHSGVVPALSFRVWLYGPGGDLLYANGGGLRVLMKPASRNEQVRVPQAEIFADEVRNANAVHLAIDPLLEPAARRTE